MERKNTGRFIAEIRKQKDMTQRDLAEAVGVSDKTISKWETGKSMPDLDCLGVLCEVLGISVNELLSGENISESDYSRKAEENIMSLMKDNEKIKKNNVIVYGLGIVFIILTLLAMQITNQGINFMPTMFFDGPTIMIIAFAIIGIVLLSGKKEPGQILRLLDKAILPIGLFVTLGDAIFMLYNLTDLATIGPNVAVCILAMLYASLIKIVVTTILACQKDAEE